jgi:hypothetical protein
MKGIIFNLFEEVVVSEHGDDAWEDMLEQAGIDGAYTAVGSYPDVEFITLLKAMPAGEANHSPDDLLRWFGAKAIPLLARRYPVFFEGHTSTRSFLLTLNDIIHPEVRKLYPDADVPVFDFDTPSTNGTLVVGYRSGRKLCELAEGFIQGAAGHFGEQVSIEQPHCMHHGDERCELVCTFG